jgi:hypothetical protein
VHGRKNQLFLKITAKMSVSFFTVPRGPAVARGPQARPVSMQHTPSGMETSSQKWKNFVAHNNS